MNVVLYIFTSSPRRAGMTGRYPKSSCRTTYVKIVVCVGGDHFDKLNLGLFPSIVHVRFDGSHKMNNAQRSGVFNCAFFRVPCSVFLLTFSGLFLFSSWFLILESWSSKAGHSLVRSITIVQGSGQQWSFIRLPSQEHYACRTSRVSLVRPQGWEHSNRMWYTRWGVASNNLSGSFNT